MKILHRYVLKEHLGPLTFALTALTSILLLQYIGKHFGQLVGTGLPTLVIAEFFGLSVPLTVALTLPMAVLVATLYAFSRLAAENEITALKASGVSLVSDCSGRASTRRFQRVTVSFWIVFALTNDPARSALPKARITASLTSGGSMAFTLQKPDRRERKSR